MKKRRIVNISLNIFLIIFAISVLVPIIYVVIISFGKNVTSLDGGVLPTSYTLQNYKDLFTEFQFKNWIINSIVISMGTMVLTLVFATVGAYVFSRFDFVGRMVTYKTILLIQIFPLTLSMVAIYKMVSMLGLINTQISLILVNTVMALPYSILLSKGYFDTIPKDLEESAYMDGASKARTLWLVIIPLVKPIIATIAISSFVLAYNEYVLANVLMSGGFESMPLAVGLRSMFAGQYGVNWPRFAAAASLGSIPMLIIFMVFQDHFVSGLTDGSVKQ